MSVCTYVSGIKKKRKKTSLNINVNERTHGTARHGMAGLVDDDTGLSCIDMWALKIKNKKI